MKLQATILAVLFAAMLPFGTGSGSARAQLADPLRVGNSKPLKDVFMRNLDGPSRGQPALVEIFSSPGRLKPAVLLTNTVVGANAMSNYGYFSVTLPSRPEVGSTIRAFAYDAPTAADASFYCIAVAEVPDAATLLLDFSDPMPMAKFGNDTEAALEDAIERQLSPDSDFDGDGMSDYAEALVRTGIENPLSLLAFESIAATPAAAARDAGDGGGENLFDVVLKWQAATNVTYRLQYTPSLLPGEVDWDDILPPIDCTAADLEPSGIDGVQFITRRVAIPLADDYLQGHFRVLVDIAR